MSQGHWSRQVSLHSHALDLEPGVFSWGDPVAIARSLWRSAEQSEQKKRTAYGSAMAMLCFYINRAGRRLSPDRLAVLGEAKQELRRLKATHISSAHASSEHASKGHQPSTGT